MKLIEDLSKVRKSGRPIVMAAGFFDGVHRGHQKVLSTARTNAAKINGQAWVMTFDVHPLKVLNPRKKPPLITSTAHKLRVIEEMDLDGCIVYPFTRATAALPASDFLESLAHNIKPLAEIVVGRNWRFGQGGEGTTRVLSRLCRDMGIKTTVVNPVIRGGGPVSSTRIRTSILRGELREAEKMLGRPVSVMGHVVGGKRMARGLGFPTANLKTDDEVLPPFGVYAVMLDLDRKPCSGVLNFGTRPTFARGSVSRPVIEIHIMNHDADIYGKELNVLFVEKLRNEKKFDSKDELRKQIDMDVRLARAVLGA